MSKHDKFLADCRRYLQIADDRAAVGQMAVAIQAGWKAEGAAVSFVRALEDERVKINKAKRSKAKGS